MPRRRISPIDRFESSDEKAREAVEGMMRWASRDRPRDAANTLLFSVLIGAGISMLVTSLGIVTWPLIAIMAMILSLQFLLAPETVRPQDVARNRLRTRWFDRALAGRVGGPAPNLLRRFRLMRDHLEPAQVIMRPANNARSRAWWLLTVAVFALGMSVRSAFDELADRRHWEAVRQHNGAARQAWNDVRRFRDARDTAMWAAVGAAAAVGAIATLVTFHGPLRIRARFLRGACPECGYDLIGVPDALSPSLGAHGCGPARCPECGSPWPRVPMATDDEAVASIRPPL